MNQSWFTHTVDVDTYKKLRNLHCARRSADFYKLLVCFMLFNGLLTMDYVYYIVHLRKLINQMFNNTFNLVCIY